MNYYENKRIGLKSSMIIMEVWIFFFYSRDCPKRPTIEYSYWTCVSGHICFLICDFCWPPVRYSLYTTNNEKQPCGTIFRPTEMQGRRFFNTSYLTDLYISFTLKLESRQNFCSNRSIRSSTYGKKYFWNSSMRNVIHFTC